MLQERQSTCRKFHVLLYGDETNHKSLSRLQKPRKSKLKTERHISPTARERIKNIKLLCLFVMLAALSTNDVRISMVSS